MNIKLVAIDIDDTLLNSAGQILPNTIAAVRQAQAKGVKIVLCTGRPLAGTRHFLDELGLSGDDEYVVTFNGAAIETVAGRVLARHLVANQHYRALTAFAQDHQVPFNVLDEDGIIYTANHDVSWVTVVQAWENHAGLLIRQPDDLPTDFSIAKGLFVGEPEQLDQIEAAVRQRFAPELYVVRAGRNFLELMNPIVNKGHAITELARLLKLPTGAIVAIGDEQNDLAMFAAAGTAVAMANGAESVKAQADFVTTSNDQDGIAHAFQKFGLID
ncbi:Cof-type HAD-IIB family hydrolase [Lapidilactobacillus salsurivasis]